MARQWVLTGQEGFETSLEYQQDVKIPSPHELGPHDVLVRMHAASLNYRDLVIAGPMGINGPITPPVIPGCDGAGIVEGVGSSVHDFHLGDRVLTHVSAKFVESRGDDALAGIADAAACLGQGSDGTLRSHGVFSDAGLVHAPKSLDWLTAATLTCTWTTAWNALFGLKGREAGPGSWVLVQGTGGVSIAALQLAVAVGATVIATTSSEEKVARLKTLGATHVINYLANPKSWGEEARGLTPGGRGVDFVIDVGGNETLPNSLAAVRVDGIVLVVGQVGESSVDAVPIFAALLHTCIVRGILAASRNQFRELVRFIDEHEIVPAGDDVVFELAEAKSAYRRLKEKKHFAKVLIKID
ncbi:hypothetical protein N7536_008191 [Penicillium majusculum]|uniref:Enoyl reductase (ER) domain-containing protein n=1 Tax=Penicillium solitum TaxID=60172 RepID=A0A1V6RIW3_9EURO|nr:uncharacterized protein PENSOL_c004G07814 [Penicillium solitum]KAJ5685572.1 hypothetical protein N7536_008191 [Penicillium majusculum]OQE01438.1 hypothetical protein PENSOL_c004G07814 [Penicillium solitum]